MSDMLSRVSENNMTTEGQQPTQEPVPEPRDDLPLTAQPADPHKALKHGLRVAFGAMAELHRIHLEPDAVRRPPSAKESLCILGFPDWDACAVALTAAAGHSRLGPQLARRRLRLCTDRSLCFRRLERPWPRVKWLAILGQLFGDTRALFFVTSLQMLHFPMLAWRILTPLPFRVTAPPEAWDRWPAGHEELRTVPRTPMRPPDCGIWGGDSLA